jgi:hypothetical protein
MPSAGDTPDKVLAELAAVKGVESLAQVPDHVIDTIGVTWEHMVPAYVGQRPFHHEDGRPRLTSSVVAFVDELGAKARIESLDDESLRTWIGAIEDAGEWFDDEGAYEVAVAFSDNLAVARPVWLQPDGWNPPTEPGSTVGSIVGTLATLQFVHMIEQCMLYRGAVVYGRIWAERGRIYGPALSEAYLRESTVAEFPRIIVDQACRDLLIATDYLDGQGDGGLLAIDGDGEAFINYLPIGVNVIHADDGYDPGELLDNHRHRIGEFMAKAKDPRVLSKLRWLGHYHNWSCAQLGLLQHQMPAGVLPAGEIAPSFRTIDHALTGG